MAESNPPPKLGYHPRDSEQYIRAERKRIALLYVKGTIVTILLLAFVAMAFALLYAAVYFFSGGDTMP